MRLWHYKLIPILDSNRLIGQNRECCALRGLGWGKKHSIVNYVFDNNYLKLSFYHKIIIWEMKYRGYNPDMKWHNDCYRGKQLGIVNFQDLPNINFAVTSFNYIEHNDKYLEECKNLLIQKKPFYYKQIFYNGGIKC